MVLVQGKTKWQNRIESTNRSSQREYTVYDISVQSFKNGRYNYDVFFGLESSNLNYIKNKLHTD